MLVASVVMAALIGTTTRYVNEDLFLAFAAGREILRGNIVLQDPWSFTAEGQVWVNQAWLSHLVLFLSYDILGPVGPVTVKVVLLAGCLWLVFLRCRSLGVSSDLSLLGLCAGALAAAPFMGIRPENFGVFFFLLFCSLLTLDRLPVIARRLGVPLILVLWSSSHGSFMLGLGLLGVKAALVTVRAVRSGAAVRPREDPASPLEWWLLTAVSLAAVALVTPFGIDNLLMPFRQVGSAAATEFSADWLPLLSSYPADQGILGPGGVYPFLGLLALFLIGGALATIGRLRRGPGKLSRNSGNVPVSDSYPGGLVGESHENRALPEAPLQNRYETVGVLRQSPGECDACAGPGSDWLMEIFIALVTVALAFKFRRLVLFSAFSLVPTAGLFFHYWLKGIPSGSEGSRFRGRRCELVKLAAAGTLLAVMSSLCWRAAIVPYLPGNPLRPERPLARELMSFDSFSPLLVEFIKKNAIDGRVLSGWSLSSYLLYHVPSLKLFMDCRDQSLYPETVIRDYFTIMGISPSHGRTPVELLDEYRVSTVILTTEPFDFELAVRLMLSKKWVCLYADLNSVLLVRSDSPLLRTAAGSQMPDGLWFPNAETHLLTRAIRSYFEVGRVPAEMVPELQEAVKTNPSPNYYSFIVSGMDRVGSCFAASTVDYLTSEAGRLSQVDPGSPGGGTVTESLEKIFGILEANALICGDAGAAARLAALKAVYRDRLRELRHRYLGIVFSCGFSMIALYSLPKIMSDCEERFSRLVATGLLKEKFTLVR